MTAAQSATSSPPEEPGPDLPLACLPELMAFQAPYLEEKLLHLKIFSRQEGRALLQEVKKYMVLTTLHPSVEIPMFSRRVDEVWHQFVLFTNSYSAFCTRFFGRFVHHAPNEEAEQSANDGAPGAPKMKIAAFRLLYEPRFGPLSDLWFDERSLTRDSRVTREEFHRPMELRTAQGKTELLLLQDTPRVMCRVDEWARPALQFVLECDTNFHVRELPGLADADRVALCRRLTEINVLSVVP
jgi:hypothetical protein